MLDGKEMILHLIFLESLDFGSTPFLCCLYYLYFVLPTRSSYLAPLQMSLLSEQLFLSASIAVDTRLTILPSQ